MAGPQLEKEIWMQNWTDKIPDIWSNWDMSRFEYRGAKVKSTFGCLECGLFFKVFPSRVKEMVQTGSKGCPECAKKYSGTKASLTNERNRHELTREEMQKRFQRLNDAFRWWSDNTDFSVEVMCFVCDHYRDDFYRIAEEDSKKEIEKYLGCQYQDNYHQKELLSKMKRNLVRQKAEAFSRAQNES